MTGRLGRMVAKKFWTSVVFILGGAPELMSSLQSSCCFIS